jgi:hypothetical protein
MLSTFLSTLPHMIALINRLIALISDHRMIALGEKKATEQALKHQSEMLVQARSIENDVTARHRRHVDDSAFDSSFERKDDA